MSTTETTTIRYEFEIFDEHDQTVASGDAPTLEDAEREGRHYLAQYHQEGPHTLEVRRVEIFMVAQTRAIAADRAQGAPCDQPPPVAAADRPRYLQETPDGWQGADHPDGP